MVHPSSVNHPKHETGRGEESFKQMVAFIEKRQNVSAGSGSSTTFLVNTTRLEPLLYVLFGAHDVQKDDQGLLLDQWITLVGQLDALDDIYDLRKYMDSCMTRVFEGIVMGRRRNRNLAVLPREEQLSESGDDAIDDTKDYSLSRTEVKELDLLTRDLVNILTQYSTERGFDSRPSTRAGTPRLLKYPGSGYSTPFGGNSQFNSRASTPTGRFRKF